MENSHFKLEVKEGVQELVIREGDALPLFPTKQVEISGAIDAPSRFIAKRNTEFNPLKSHVLINRDNQSIELIINEDSHTELIKVTGELKISKDFTKLGINSGKEYSPNELSQTLKMMRSFFTSLADWTNIVHTLKNLKAKVNKSIEDSSDDRGNKTVNFNQVVESNMPDSFELNLCLIKGEPNYTISIDVLLEAKNHDIVCYLESIEAQDLMTEITNSRIDEEIIKIQDFTTVIEK